VSDQQAPSLPIRSIRVRILVGQHMLSASDDPLFLGLRGPSGREFRLALAHGKSLRRSSENCYVFGAPDDSEVNVAHPELNDPTAPPIDAAGITGIFLRKGLDPIPNVRAIGEMDDRLEIIEAEVALEVAGESAPRVYHRSGPVWLGLICGLFFELPPVDGAS
jgi:hypothetical protein